MLHKMLTVLRIPLCFQVVASLKGFGVSSLGAEDGALHHSARLDAADNAPQPPALPRPRPSSAQPPASLAPEPLPPCVVHGQSRPRWQW